MTRVSATYDGHSLVLDEPLPIPANTRVTLSIEEQPAGKGAPLSFLQTAMSLKLEGPADFSERLHDYLYGDRLDGDS